jgi:hypothetical protein
VSEPRLKYHSRVGWWNVQRAVDMQLSMSLHAPDLRKLLQAMLEVMTESQRIRVLESLGWVVEAQQVPPQKGVAAQP